MEELAIYLRENIFFMDVLLVLILVVGIFFSLYDSQNNANPEEMEKAKRKIYPEVYIKRNWKKIYGEKLTPIMKFNVGLVCIFILIAFLKFIARNY